MADSQLHEFKTCTKCHQSKPETNKYFSLSKKVKCGFRSHCKSCVNAAEKQRRLNNLQREKERAAAWYAANKERRQRKSAEWYAANKDRVAANRLARIKADPEGMRRKWREQANRRYQTDPNFRVSACVSPAIRKSLRSSKAGRSWQDVVGYSRDDLIEHLKRQFKPGMSLENYGEVWEIDHIRPVASFELSKGEEEIKACWALSNLRPLEVRKNRAKGKKLVLLV